MSIRVQPLEIEIPEDDPFRYDLLDRREAVDTLTHLVGNLEGPCVLAVDAAWGFGKTTFFRMWSQHLRNQGFPAVVFNAWETDFSEDPFLTLSRELTESLQTGDTTLMEASRAILRWVGPRAGHFAVAQVPVIGPELAGAAASFVEEKLSRHSKARTSIKQFRQALQDMTTALAETNGNRPLMVMIDELDRCRPSYAVKLLEVAKHLFSVNHVVFVLAVNCDQLAHSVTALYGNDFDAEGYLRRFFDVDFKLPEPERQAFIAAQLQTTGINDYFDLVTRNASLHHGTHLPHAAERKDVGEALRAMLFQFFGSSDLSLRTVGQAVNRLGMLYASLRKDQRDHGMATTVALILRTMEPRLYGRFVAGEVSDAEIVDAIFDRPGLKTLRFDKRSATFEAAVILAGMDDTLPHHAPTKTQSSPLLDRYDNWDRTDRETFDGEELDDAARRESNHAERVARMVNQQLEWGITKIGFNDAVRRLELLSDSLIDNHVNFSPKSS